VRAVALLAVAFLVGCGDEPATRGPQPAEPPKRDAPPVRIEPVRCEPGAANCRAATGRVLYLESVDPDGDGDLHVVLTSTQSVSGPGITIVDVKPSLRPRRDPRVGDLVAAAGPIYRGSYGQRQIEAVAVRFKRSR
jgi:hypothetical protein